MKKGYCAFCEMNVEAMAYVDMDGTHWLCHDCGMELKPEKDIETKEIKEKKEEQKCF